jgi:hypothetical protein
MLLFSGRIPSPLPDLRFLLDSSLDRNVADALALVDYQFTSIFKVWEGKDGIKDPEIIDWCGDHDHVWVHADDRAKREHRKQIISLNIRTIWVYRKDGKMTGAQQLRALSFRIEDIGREFLTKPGIRHYKLGVHGQSEALAMKVEAYYLT